MQDLKQPLLNVCQTILNFRHLKNRGDTDVLQLYNQINGNSSLGIKAVIEEYWPRVFYIMQLDEIKEEVDFIHCYTLCKHYYGFIKRSFCCSLLYFFYDLQTRVSKGYTFQIIMNPNVLICQSNAHWLYKYSCPPQSTNLFAHLDDDCNKLYLHNAKTGLRLSAYIEKNDLSLIYFFYSSSRGLFEKTLKYNIHYNIQFSW